MEQESNFLFLCSFQPDKLDRGAVASFNLNIYRCSVKGKKLPFENKLDRIEVDFVPKQGMIVYPVLAYIELNGRGKILKREIRVVRIYKTKEESDKMFKAIQDGSYADFLNKSEELVRAEQFITSVQD